MSFSLISPSDLSFVFLQNPMAVVLLKPAIPPAWALANPPQLLLALLELLMKEA
jgi:hypothetical protein